MEDGARRETRRAEEADLPAVLALLAETGLPTEGVASSLSGFRVVREAGRLVAVAGLERYGGYGLLRSVAVAPDRRGGGLAARVTQAVVGDAAGAGLEAIYALTTTAAGYFPRLGFEVIERSDVPAAVQASQEFAALCPASAAALRLELKGRAGEP